MAAFLLQGFSSMSWIKRIGTSWVTTNLLVTPLEKKVKLSLVGMEF